MNYVDNGALKSAFDDRVAALNTKIANLTDGSTTKVVIEDTGSNVLLASLSLDSVESPSGVLTPENPEVVSNEQAPQITIETPTLTLEPEEGSEEEGDQEEDHGTDEDTDDGVDQEQEETAEDSVEENTDEVTEEDENS